MSTSEDTVEMAMVVYNPTNTARHPLRGQTKQVLGRPINYGYRKAGEVFNVAIPDIVAVIHAHPNMFLAYPCKKPFHLDRYGRLISPCEIEEGFVPEVKEEDGFTLGAGEETVLETGDGPAEKEESVKKDGKYTLESVPGIGPSVAKSLDNLGIKTEEDLLAADDDTLNHLYAPARKAIREWKEAQGKS